MMGTRFFIALAMSGIAAGFCGNVQAASRSEVSTAVQASCTSDGASCLAAVNSQIASLRCKTDGTSSSNCSCSSEALETARGLADATTAISKTNAPLATAMAEAVAKGAIACAQVAFGAILDGTGTAAIADPNAGTPAAGSPG